MGIDRSFNVAKTIVEEVAARLDTIDTEQDARLQLINRFLIEVLDWDFGSIKTETYSEAGFADYLLRSGEQKLMVVEAKRTGEVLVDTAIPRMRSYKVSGPALKSAEEGIKQALGYCVEHGTNYAVVTNGIAWIGFVPMPGAGLGAYMSVEQCRQYFEAMNISEAALTLTLHELLERRLIEPYDASDESLDKSQRVAVTYAGRMHYEMALNDSLYVGEMALVTPVRSMQLVERIRAIWAKKMNGDEWREVEGLFVRYCLDEDRVFANLPSDPIYDGQRQLRQDLQGRWVEARGTGESLRERQVADEAQVQTQGFSYLPVVVKWFNSDRQYGFVEGGLGEGIFLHQRALDQAEIDSVTQGDTLLCDVARGSRGRLQVIAVHTVRRQNDNGAQSGARLTVVGLVEMFNFKKGYGFIKTAALPEDVYFSVEIADQATVGKIRVGAQVRVDVDAGRYGRGYMATTLELVEGEGEPL